MPIDPVSLPDAAGLNYGEGDVRHFSEGDAMDVPGLSRPTRNLAERDNTIAEKLNEVISVVNNKEQFVPLLPFRTTLPPNSEEVVLNYRIPSGFEARILNAIVTSIPASSSAELDVYYATGYGNSTGTQIVSTSTEFTAGTQFFSAGEFIVTLKNRGGATLEMIASIQSTMRPLTETAGILIASTIVGEAGPPGPQGPQGVPGAQGNPGAAGSPGLTWQSTWNSASTYSATDVVFWLGSSWKSKINNNTNNQPDITPSSWEFLAQKGAAGLTFQGVWNSAQTYNVDDGVEYLGSSYFCIVANSNKPPATNPANWTLLAQGGTGFRFRGPWTNPPVDGLGSYLQNDVVTVLFSGSITQTYIAVGNPPNPVTSPPNSDWNQLFSAGSPAFSVNNITSNIYAEASYVAVSSEDQFTGLAIPAYPGTVSYSLQEVITQDAASGHGIGFLKTFMYARWIGDITLTLPNTGNGAQLDWLGTNVVLSIQSTGSLIFSGIVPSISSGPAVVPGQVINGTVPTQITSGVSVPAFTTTGTVNTLTDSGGQVPGFPITTSGTAQVTPGAVLAGFSTTGTFNTELSGPVTVPAQVITVSGNVLTTVIVGNNITIHSPTNGANNVTIGLIGMQVF